MFSYFFRRKKFFRTITIVCFALNSVGIADEIDVIPLQTTLEFQEAYSYALTKNLKAMDAEVEVEIRQAEKLQVGLRPNPQLSISLDGPSNGNNWNNSDNDISIGLTQLFELGGKRRARVRVAEAAQFETSWGLEIAKCDLYADVLHAFIETAAAQERLMLSKDFQNIAEQSLQCISSKNECGKIPLLDAKKANIAFKIAKLASSKRTSDFQNAKIKLASLWNSNQPHFDHVEYDLFNTPAPPPYGQLTEELENNPELARAQAEVTKAWEMTNLQKTQRIPDMAVYVGVCTARNFHDPALSLGVNIPLPIFDRNQGNIARAGHELTQVIFKQNDLINKLKVRMKILYRDWTLAYQQAAELREIIDTVANEAYFLAEERYALGKSDFLDFLDARSTLFSLRQEYLDAVEEYHHKRTEIMQLLAKCCSEVING